MSGNTQPRKPKSFHFPSLSFQLTWHLVIFLKLVLAFLFRCFIQITPEENMKSWQRIPEFGSLFPDGFPLSISKISQLFFFSPKSDGLDRDTNSGIFLLWFHVWVCSMQNNHIKKKKVLVKILLIWK